MTPDHGLSKFEVVTTTHGALSIKNNVVNEIMHNPVGPWVESNELYIRQSDFAKKACDPHLLHRDLVVFDVGLGAASNSMAALAAWEDMEFARKLRIVSYENDMSLLEFALSHADRFDHLRERKSILRELIQNGSFENEDGSFVWQIRKGDFSASLLQEETIPDIIFYDPYSPKMNPEMWHPRCFKRLFELADRNPTPVLLITYSLATPVRSALLSAGFFVGTGKGCGLKEESTLASTRQENLHQPLDHRWLTRWKRSKTPYPPGLTSDDQIALEKTLLSHPQFKDLQNLSAPY